MGGKQTGLNFKEETLKAGNLRIPGYLLYFILTVMENIYIITSYYRISG